MSFESYPLHETILANIKATGFTEPTPIQAQIFPIALEGKDVSGLSRTGTGKTAAFLIPTIHRLTTLPTERLALCLAPTRELAQQIQNEATWIGKGLDIHAVSVVGGMSSEDQIKSIRNGARVIAGTPGRIIDLFKNGELNLANVDILVFDEADRMFDMGFIKDMKYILSKINPKRQVLLFSATMNFSVQDMLFEFGANPEEVNVSRDQVTADKIQQVLYHVADDEKPSALLGVCKKHSPDGGSIIVFVNYKERVPWVAALLSKNGIPAQGLSSLMRQEKRNKIMQGFKKGTFRALVATDVASRGIDIDDISLVVNYHLPEEAATYVHRIGRTARAGKTGIAVSVSSSEDAYNQMRIEEFLGNKIPVEWFGDNEIPTDTIFPGRVEERDEDDEVEGNQMENKSEGRHPREQRGRHPRGRNDRPHREHREHREPRAPRAEQGAEPHVDGNAQHATERGPRHPRHDRNNRDRGHRRDHRHDHRDRRPREDHVDPATLPNPLTGSPIIYCMKTGKPKNRSADEFKSIVNEYEKRVGAKKGKPAIIKKISSKVTALFGSRK